MKTASRLSATEKMELAFFELLEKKHYSKIAVSELIEKAGVSRTTFYRHYVDIFDMYKKVCEHIIEEFLKKAVLRIAVEPNTLKANNLFDVLVELLTIQKKYICLLSGNHGDRYFYDLVLSIVYKNLDILPFKLSQEETFKLKFIIMAGISSYVKSLITDTKLTKDILTISNSILNYIGSDIDIEEIKWIKK